MLFGGIIMAIFGGCFGAIIFTIMFFSGVSSGNTPLIVISCIGFFGSGIAGLLLDDKKEARIKNEVAKKLDKVIKDNQFNPIQSFTSDDLGSYIGIDENNRQIGIIENTKDTNKTFEFSSYEYEFHLINYNDIIRVSILEDGNSTTTTNRGSQIGGALIGGAIAGGVGAVIGGLSGSKKTTSEVKKIEIQIDVNDMNRPFHRITIVNFKTSVPKNGYAYKNHEKKVAHWYDILRLIIKDNGQTDNKEKIKPITSKNEIKGSVADEIIKLDKLHKDGIITQEEFNKQKAKLLSQ